MPEFVSSVKTEFTDRDRALAQVVEWAEKSTSWPVVVFGPEGCGKTAFFGQAAFAMRELGCDFFYLHLLDRVFSAEVDDADVETLLADLVRKTLEEKWGRFALVVFDLTREIDSEEAQAEDRRHLYAVFQAIGLDIAVAYVNGLLNTIEYPVYDYGNIVVLVTASERISREDTDGLF